VVPATLQSARGRVFQSDLKEAGMAKVASIFKLHVKEGREREFVDRVNAYAEIVRRTEPGTLYYEYYRLRKPRWYAVVECFADQAGEDAHMASAALAEHAPGIVDCLAEPFIQEHLDPFIAP
jgi:quinol monooxygenase YgiN